MDDDEPSELALSGALSCCPSPGPGGDGGDDLMQDFVRLHMLSILQPIAGNVQELQRQLHQVTSDVAAVSQAAARCEIRTNAHEQKISSLQAGAADGSGQLENLQTQMSAAKKDRNRLDGNHEMTKASVCKAKDECAKLALSLEALRESFGESCNKIDVLETELPESEKRLTETIDLRLNKQGRACKDLNERQEQLAKSCQHATAMSENASAAVKKLSKFYDSMKQEQGDDQLGIVEQVAGICTKLLDLDSAFQKQGHHLESTDREILHLRTWTEQLKDVKQLYSDLSDTGTALEAVNTRVHNLEANVDEVRNQAMSEVNARSSELCSLQQTYAKHVADIGRYKDTQKAHCDLINSTGKRLIDLENGQAELSARSNSHEDEIQITTTWRCDAQSCLDRHESGLDTIRLGLTGAEQGIKEADKSLQRLRNELSGDREGTAKLQARVELCYKYFNGLGKGLQDVNRQIVTGDIAIMPSKLGGQALPAIPRQPGTPRKPSTPRGPALCSPRDRMQIANR